jgi:hypothetical protein
MTKVIDVDSLPPVSVTSPDLYDQTLEQVLLTPVVLDKNTRITVRFFDVLDGRMARSINAVAYFSSKKSDRLSYSKIIATAIVHGFTIIEHRHHDLFGSIEALHADSVMNTYKVFEEVFQGVSVRVKYGDKTLSGHTDRDTYDAIASRAFLLNIRPSQLITSCIIASFNGYQYFSPDVRDVLKTKDEMFDISCNILLKTLQDYKY